MENTLNTIAHDVSVVIAAAAMLMAILPQGKPGSTWDKIRSFVNYAAMNWGNAKNQRQ